MNQLDPSQILQLAQLGQGQPTIGQPPLTNSLGVPPQVSQAMQLLNLLVPATHELRQIDYNPFAKGMPGGQK